MALARTRRRRQPTQSGPSARLTGVNIDIGVGTPNWIPFARFRYDPLGRRIAAIYDNGPDGTLDNDYVEFYGYDDSWRLTTVWRQGAVRASGPGVGSRPNPVLYERFLHNPGWGAVGGASMHP